MNITKNYLKTSEINTIVKDMVEQETYLQAIVSRDIMILYLCTDLDIPVDEKGYIDASFDIYDKYKEDGIIDKVLSEINENDLLLIDECYQNEISMHTSIKKFLEDLDKKIDKYAKGVNLQKVLDNLKEAVK